MGMNAARAAHYTFLECLAVWGVFSLQTELSGVPVYSTGAANLPAVIMMQARASGSSPVWD